MCFIFIQFAKKYFRLLYILRSDVFCKKALATVFHLKLVLLLMLGLVSLRTLITRKWAGGGGERGGGVESSLDHVMHS